jgi:polar amino acid transport system substrate-binding protein
MKRSGRAIAVATLLVAAACSSEGTSTSASTGSPAGDPLTDKLAQILDRGTLVAYYEPEYPPQSVAVEGAERPADTACADDQITAAEITGFDVETTKLVAEGLGVEACFVSPSYTEVTAGNWGDRWDIAYASGSINEDRMQRLWMTQPYYAVPNYYFVATDSVFDTASDLDGKRIGACASCSHEMYLHGELVIPGIEVVQTVEDPEVVTYETEPPGLEAVAEGEIDAFLAAGPVGQAQIEEGLDLRQIDEIAFTYYPAGFIDKASDFDVAAFAARVNEIIQAAHADGTLAAMSQEFFGEDFAAAAAEYDVDALEQTYA